MSCGFGSQLSLAFLKAQAALGQAGPAHHYAAA